MLTNDVVDSAGPQLAMDLFAFSEDNDANIVQWPANGLANQQWKLSQPDRLTTHYCRQATLLFGGLPGGFSYFGINS